MKEKYHVCDNIETERCMQLSYITILLVNKPCQPEYQKQTRNNLKLSNVIRCLWCNWLVFVRFYNKIKKKAEGLWWIIIAH